MSTEYLNSLKNLIDKRQSRLAFSYLAVIMSLTIIFSVVIYKTSALHFERFRPLAVEQRVDLGMFEQRRVSFINNRDRAKASIITDLVLLNLFALLSGSIFSYYLAGRTLKPIEKAMSDQNQFISDASHELRTPLSTIQTSTEVMLKTENNLSKDMQEFLTNNVEQVEKLRSLTDGLLGLIKAEQNQIYLKPFDISNAVDESIKLTEGIAEKKKIKIANQISRKIVVGDENGIIRVLRILVENAVKYSGAKSNVSIKQKVRGNKLIISVIDSGIGIAEDDFEHIFKRFYRVDTSRSSQNTEGYGLGLAIAKTICDKQDIPIGVTSKIGTGTTFTLTLPLAKD